MFSHIFFSFYHLIKNVVVFYIEQCYFAIRFVLDLNILFFFSFDFCSFLFFFSLNVSCCVEKNYLFCFVDYDCSFLHILTICFATSSERYFMQIMFYQHNLIRYLLNNMNVFFFDTINCPFIL
jgi:hypothetical protein